jgi:phosphatidylserine/phosphatidylglycerophosphate/cardiolipin synthase-like enzyme
MEKIFSVIALICVFAIPATARETVQATVSVCFTPAQSCVDPIISAINRASKSVLVQAYGFTSTPILQALMRAKQRGVDVRVILDKSNDRSESGRLRYSGATTMNNAGIQTFIDFHPAIAHNKIIVIDGNIVIGGSFNYTKSADERNAENVTFIESPVSALWFMKNWQSRLSESRSFVVTP